MNEKRGPWYLLTGLLLGIGLGILYSWMIAPAQPVDVSPQTLSANFKDEYRLQIALAYTANNDLARAQSRLALLQDPDLPRTLAAQAQRALANGRPADEVRALGLLAVAAEQLPADIPTAVPLTEYPTSPPSPTIAPQPPTLTPSPGVTPTATAALTPTAAITTTEPLSGTATATPRPTRTPTPTNLPPATLTPTPTPGQPFILEQRTLVCDPDLPNPLIIIRTRDAADGGVPGVEIIVSWPAGEEHFFTGLKPEFGLEYADFTMTPGITYRLRIADGGQIVTDLTAPECDTEDDQRILGSWELLFVQP